MSKTCSVCGAKGENLFSLTLNTNNRISFQEVSHKDGVPIVSVCKTTDCINGLRQNKILEQTFDCPGLEKTYLSLAQSLSRNQTDRLHALLGMALKSRQIFIGRTAVEQAAGRQKLNLILIDSTAKENTREKIYSTARQNNVAIREWREAGSLEDIVQKNNCKVVGISNANIAVELLEMLNK